jgi:hypothetical protein
MDTYPNRHENLIQLFVAIMIIFVATLIGGVLISYGALRVAYLMPVVGFLLSLLYLRSGREVDKPEIRYDGGERQDAIDTDSSSIEREIGRE